VFDKINYISKTLIISGLFVSLLERYLGIEWLDLIGMSLLMIGLYYAKSDVIALHDDYGLYLYYVLLLFTMAIIFMYWFY
jgi:hypothetical protein